MPNHFHLLLQPNVKGGVSLFMQKLSTGYSMYFNKRYERTGTLLQGKFKAKIIDSDEYFRRVLNYIHGNAAELFETGWKEGKIDNRKLLMKKLSSYSYSSLPDFIGGNRNVGRLLDKAAILPALESKLTLEQILEEAEIFKARSDLAL